MVRKPQLPGSRGKGSTGEGHVMSSIPTSLSHGLMGLDPRPFAKRVGFAGALWLQRKAPIQRKKPAGPEGKTPGAAAG